MGIRRMAMLLMIQAVWTGAGLATEVHAQKTRAGDLVRLAADRMGGENVLRGVRHVEFEMMTQWQRTTFRAIPSFDRPSYERHLDQRDYALGAWRNRRDFGARSITNLIIDSVAVTDMGRGFEPLSAAYVDERDELYTYTPDRAVLAFLDAPDVRSLADTLIGGEPHHVVLATLSGRYPGRLYLHRGTGLPTSLHFSAGHPNDFGLVQWGEMEVEVWYSNWRTFGPISIPRQWDIFRVGVPYKRLTVQSADFESPLPDSLFDVGASQRAAYWASMAPRPMHETRAIDSVATPAPSVVLFQPGFGTPAGAVDTGDGWLLLGAGQADFNFRQTVDRMNREGIGSATAVLIGESRPGNGGVVAAARNGFHILVAGAAEAGVRAMLSNHGIRDTTLEVIDSVRSVGQASESTLVAPVDLPDAPGSVLLYKPALEWLLVPEGSDPLTLRIARERAEELGWTVTRLGHPRDPWGDGSPSR